MGSFKTPCQIVLQPASCPPVTAVKGQRCSVPGSKAHSRHWPPDQASRVALCGLLAEGALLSLSEVTQPLPRTQSRSQPESLTRPDSLEDDDLILHPLFLSSNTHDQVERPCIFFQVKTNRRDPIFWAPSPRSPSRGTLIPSPETAWSSRH